MIINGVEHMIEQVVEDVPSVDASGMYNKKLSKF